MNLNTTYKIFAKALQQQLQRLLLEEINNDQTIFLPLWFIVDNILLTHESIQWAKESHQESIFLKLDFSKTYNRLDWALMFQIMRKLGMQTTCVKIIRILFHDAIVSVNINNQAT